jgi:hypothetical protein
MGFYSALLRLSGELTLIKDLPDNARPASQPTETEALCVRDNQLFRFQL